MSIDIKTLHIGSHVLIDGKRVRVDEILTVRPEGHPIKLTVSRNKLVDGFVSIEDVEPILLTPALLEELGFAWKDEGCWQHWWKGGFDLTRRGESSYWDYEGDLSVQYLHELESLYYLIYQEELIKD